MSVQEILYLKHNKNDIKKTSMIMAIHCAPLIMGIKAANIITVSARELMIIRQMLAGTGISYYILKLIPRSGRVKENKHILYLFRKKELIDYLSKNDVSELLCDYGYDNQLEVLKCLYNNLDLHQREKIDENIDITIAVYKLLKRLSDRIMMYCGGKIEFPHEIGAFLEYPVEDIRGFLTNKGENFLYCGYWKVYHNVNQAIDLFRKYDMAREHTLREIVDGKSIRDIAV